jgi:hypothetical protein
MASDDTRQATEAAEFWQKLNAMVATTTYAKKMYDAARARVLAATALLEEEQHVAAALAEEAHTAAALIEPPSPTLPPSPCRSHCSIGQRLRGCYHWQHPRLGRRHVEHPFSHLGHAGPLLFGLCLLAQQRLAHPQALLSLSDHVLLDTTYVGIPAWDQMDVIVKSWIWGTISPDLRDVTWQRSHMAGDAWLALENHFLSNRKTDALHIDATFWSFIQGDLSVNDYCWKIKGFTDSLSNLGIDITNRILMLNVLRGLNKNFEHLHSIFTHVMPFPPFQKVLDNLYLEEIQQGI